MKKPIMLRLEMKQYEQLTYLAWKDKRSRANYVEALVLDELNKNKLSAQVSDKLGKETNKLSP